MVNADTTEDRLFLIDASGSMKEKLKKGQGKLDVVKSGLKTFCLNLWPSSYYNIPLNIGIVAFRLLGTPGATVFETIVPISPPPSSLELFRLDDLSPKGGSWFAEGLEYAFNILNESTRKVKRIDFVSDGTPEGPNPYPPVQKMKAAGIVLNVTEVSDTRTTLMEELARVGGGSYRLAKDQESFNSSLE